jgi:hypothetical protein
MKAVTIRQPWAQAILHLGKDVENRSWRTLHRGPLLIHAASYRELHPREKLSENMSKPPSSESLKNLPIGCIVGILDIVGCVRRSKSKWADTDSWHWLIENPRPIRPATCSRRLGLWTPSAAVMRRLPLWIRKPKADRRPEHC